MAWVEYGDAIWTCRDGLRKTKVQMDPNIVRHVKNNERDSTAVLIRRDGSRTVYPFDK